MHAGLNASPEVEDCFAAESLYSEAADCLGVAACPCRPEAGSLSRQDSGSADFRAGSATAQASDCSDFPAGVVFPFPAAGRCLADWFPAGSVDLSAACCRRVVGALFLSPGPRLYSVLGFLASLRCSRPIRRTLPSRLAPQTPSRSLRVLKSRCWESPKPPVLPLLKLRSNEISSRHTSRLACCFASAVPEIADHSKSKAHRL